MCRFYVYKRNPQGIYYAEFRDQSTKKRIAFRSTGKVRKNEAITVAADWAMNGIPDRFGNRQSWAYSLSVREIIQSVTSMPITPEDALKIVKALEDRGLHSSISSKRRGPSVEPFCTWLRSFWNFDTSKYIAEKIAHGQRATKRHCQDMTSRVKDIEAIIGSKITLGEIKRSHLSDLGVSLKRKGLAASTVNKTVSVVTTALRWAAVNELISIDPTRGLKGFSGEKRKRGILEHEEALTLFTIEWPDERARIASLLAMTTGMRIGEILAVQHKDIGQGRLHVNHSYSIRDKLKTPKNGEIREAILLPELRDALLQLEKRSPHLESPTRFVFAGRYPEGPLDQNRILFGFRQALVIARGVPWEDEGRRNEILEEYRKRWIDFHSWRHFYSKYIADRVDSRTGQLGTGHKSKTMFEHYADHVTDMDMNRLEEATIDAFTSFLGS